MGPLFAVHVVLGLAANPKIKAKFDGMMTACTLPPQTIECIDDKKMRALFRGVSAAADDYGIRTAFQIVYEDLGPVRVAGDLIFNQLQRVAGDASERSAALTDVIDDSQETAETLAATRSLFDLLDGDASGGLDRSELLDSPELLVLIRQEDEADETAVDRFLASADTDGDGQVSFLEYCLYAAEAGADTSLAGRAVQDALDESMQRRRHAAADAVDEETAATAVTGRRRRKKGTPTERFDEMLTTCLEWEEALQLADCSIDPEPDECEAEQGRFALVLKGTFTGARNAHVAEALRLCYEDYSPLRFGGDLIFALLKRIVAGKLKGMGGKR